MLKVFKALKYLIPAKIRHQLKAWYWKKRNLGLRRLPSGVSIRLNSFHDWIIFNEVFENEEYRKPVQETIADTASSQSITIVDLGANIGAFTLYFIHQLTQKESTAQASVFLVEAAAENYSRLLRELKRNKRNNIKVHCYQNLVGEKTGSGVLSLEAPHYGFKLSKETEEDLNPNNSTKVAFINLSATLKDQNRINLLKCDIEGAELLFLKNYPDILKKSEKLCLEVHSKEALKEVQCILQDSGFTHVETLSEREGEQEEFWAVLYAKRKSDSGQNLSS